MSDNRLYLFDTTLRDGAQTQGIDFSVSDKNAIAEKLDALGIDYVEGGWPGANPTDTAFFGNPPTLKSAQFTAFGMTKRAGRSVANDPGLSGVINAGTPAVCLVGKTWDFHVDVALNVPREDNLTAITESIAAVAEAGREPLFDCEHFFDGYKANPDYALACAKAAYEAGARWVVLCDTNGGALPDEIDTIVRKVTEHIPGDRLGIHAHNDTENAVANSLAAVRAGVRHVQGTLNGIGERCGNANLVSLIPTLMLKMGFETGIAPEKLKDLTTLSRWFDEYLNRPPHLGAAYVGGSAFAHKGGLHASAMAKDKRSYEHIDPSLVGNRSQILVSDQAGKANFISQLNDMGIDVDAKDPRLDTLVQLVKQREFDGFAYDGAVASFEMLARRRLGQVPEFFELQRFSVTDERRYNARGELITESVATVKVRVGNEEMHTVAEGNGPVNALDRAMRKALEPIYPVLHDMRLADYRVRILKAVDASGAMPRVQIDSMNGDGTRWSTVGVSTNIIEASFKALDDSFTYKLFHSGADSHNT